MKDNLEKFILENKPAFDSRTPNEKIWSQIEKNISPKKRFNYKLWLTRAAVVLIIFTASYFFHEKVDINISISSKNRTNEMKLNIPEIKELEMYYSALLKEKYSEIKPYLSEYPSLENEINLELNELDSLYKSLKSDLVENIAAKEVLEAMTQNYRLRLAILEDILSEFKPEDDEKNEKNSQFDI